MLNIKGNWEIKEINLKNGEIKYNNFEKFRIALWYIEKRAIDVTWEIRLIEGGDEAFVAITEAIQKIGIWPEYPTTNDYLKRLKIRNFAWELRFNENGEA